MQDLGLGVYEMKLILLFALTLMTTIASANEKLFVSEVISSDEIIAENQSGQKWKIKVGMLCLRISQYDGKAVTGVYSTTPTELFAKLLLPISNDTCTIESAEKI